MTEKQIWARKRNWLIRRLMGAKSIFTWDNVVFMESLVRESDWSVGKCEDAIDTLIEVIRKSTYKET